MKSRRKKSRKNISDLTKRPSRQFLELMKNLLDESEEVMGLHSIYFRPAKFELDKLVLNFAELEKFILNHEAKRFPYTRHRQLEEEYQAAQSAVAVASAELRDIQSEVVKYQWERELLTATTSMHLKQMRVFNAQRTRDIETHHCLRVAEKYLVEMERQADKPISGCLSSAKRELASEKLVAQRMLVAQLEFQLNQPITSPELVALQKQIDALHEKIMHFDSNHEKMIEGAKQSLALARQQMALLESDSRNDELQYYTNIDADSMRSVIQVFTQLQLYTKTLEHIVANNLRDKNEILGYQQRLAATINRFETWMDQLWSKDLQNKTASKIYQQTVKMDPTEVAYHSGCVICNLSM